MYEETRNAEEELTGEKKLEEVKVEEKIVCRSLL